MQENNKVNSEDEETFTFCPKKYIGKKNSFLNEIRLLFHSYENLGGAEKDNKSIKNIFLIFHFFILLFIIFEDKDEIKSYYNDF